MENVYAVFLSDLVTLIKIVSYAISFHDPYLVKSINLVFSHVQVILSRTGLKTQAFFSELLGFCF